MSKVNENADSFNAMLRKALDAGYSAAQAVQVQKMRVIEADPLTGQPLPGARPSEAFEPCGFAWVKVPGNTPFGRYVKKTYPQKFRKAYGPGLQYWVSDFEQSMYRKEAFAQAMARVLREHGVEAYADSRMD